MQLLPINKAAACLHVYSVFYHILCRSLAYADSFRIGQDSSFGLSLFTFYVSTLSVFATVVSIKPCQMAQLSLQDGKMPFGTIVLIPAPAPLPPFPL